MTKATDVKNQKSSKIITAVETLSLSEGYDVGVYINKLVSELFHDGKELNIIAYTDNQSLHDAVHTLQKTQEKQLLADISAVREIFERNEINITWIEKTKQTSEIFTIAGASPNIISGVLSSIIS